MSKLDIFLLELDKAEAADSGQNAARSRFQEAARREAEECAQRLSKAKLGAGDFTVYELLYSAGFRCACGAGMAYPDGIGIHGAWYCSAILLGQADLGTEHTPSHPFSLYEIKSENSKRGTTRPKGTHLEIKPTYACHNCGNAGEAPRYRTEEDRPRDIACSECGTRYLNDNGSCNSKLHTRWLHVVIDDDAPGTTTQGNNTDASSGTT